MNDDRTRANFASNIQLKGIRFQTQSDARLADLLLDKLNNSNIALFEQLLDIVTGADSQSGSVTSGSVLDLFDYIWAARSEAVVKRSVAFHASPDAPATRSYLVPSVALDMVVEHLLKDIELLGIAAMVPLWRTAFKRNGATFRNMSLVHPSWTAAAHRGLRYRAVVPYQHINKFLLNPLCGPWIKEMIVYWTPYEGHAGIEEGDLVLLGALLKRTPHLRSLSLNTVLVWRSECIGPSKPSLRIDQCLEIISALLPNLENLWLKHFDPLGESEFNDRDYPSDSLESCEGMGALATSMTRMKSLKFLSLHSWRMKTSDAQMDLGLHLPSGLKSLELNLSDNYGMSAPPWFVNLREDFQLESLAVAPRSGSVSSLKKSVNGFLPQLRKLAIFPSDFPYHFQIFCQDVLAQSNNLISFDLFLMERSQLAFSSVKLPRSLEYLALHYNEEDFSDLLSPDSSELADLVKELKDAHGLQSLQKLVITGSPELSEEMLKSWHLDAFIHHMDTSTEMAQEVLPEALLESCNEYNVNLVCIQNAFPRRWYIFEDSIVYW